MKITIKFWAWINVICMFIVVLMGALVTKTGSGEGCGRSWPMCHGNLLPDHTIESLIEYSHRMVSGVAGFLVLGILIYAWRNMRQPAFTVAFWAAMSGFFFTMLQAFLGAMAVVWPQSPPILALHFGFSLMALSSTVAFLVWLNPEKMSIPRSDRKMVWWMLSIWVFTYGVIYLGALVRHTKSTGGCFGWPTCNGAWLPDETWTTAAFTVFAHRLGAAWLFAFLIALFFLTRKLNLSTMFRQAAVRMILICAIQIFSGAFIVWTLGNGPLQLLTSMAHILFLSWLFIVMSNTILRLLASK